MTLTAVDAARLLDACSAGIVVFGVLIAGTRSIGRAIWLVAAQAILLSAAVAARRPRHRLRRTSSSAAC